MGRGRRARGAPPPALRCCLQKISGLRAPAARAPDAPRHPRRVFQLALGGGLPRARRRPRAPQFSRGMGHWPRGTGRPPLTRPELPRARRPPASQLGFFPSSVGLVAAARAAAAACCAARSPARNGVRAAARRASPAPMHAWRLSRRLAQGHRARRDLRCPRRAVQRRSSQRSRARGGLAAVVEPGIETGCARAATRAAACPPRRGALAQRRFRRCRSARARRPRLRAQRVCSGRQSPTPPLARRLGACEHCALHAEWARPPRSWRFSPAPRCGARCSVGHGRRVRCRPALSSVEYPSEDWTRPAARATPTPPPLAGRANPWRGRSGPPPARRPMPFRAC